MPLQITGTLKSNVWTTAMGDGSLAAPSYTFSNNSTVGMYRAGTSLAFAASGANTMVVSGNGTLTVGNVALGPSGFSGNRVMGPWIARNSAADNNWHAVAWSPELSLFAAVAYSGTGNRVMTSPDGYVWTSRVSASDSVWTSIVWVPAPLKLFVAVGFSVACTSPDGVTWTTRTASASQFYGLAWSPSLSLLVAVGQTNGLGFMSSPDGVTWTTRTTPGDKGWQGVAWAPSLGLFAAVGVSGTGNRIATSSNGVNWTLRTSPADNNWVGIAWSPELGLFAATSITGTGNRAMTSSNGIDWVLRATPSDQEWRSLLWLSDLGAFVAVAFGGGYAGVGNKVMYSYDGITWTTSTKTSSVSLDNNWLGATYSPELKRLAVVGQSGTGNRVMTAEVLDPVGSAQTPLMRFAARANTGLYSAAANTLSIAAGGVGVMDVAPDGVRISGRPAGGLGTWTAQTSAADNNWTNIAWSPTLKMFAAVTNTGTTNRVQTSIDGLTWVIRTTPNLDLYGIRWGNGLFVAVGTSAIVTSSDGITWTSRTVPAAINYRGVAWSPSLSIFAAVALTGTNNRVATSADGITWIARTPASNNDWIDIEWSPQLGLFAAVANTGTNTRIQTSVDGINWVTRTTPDSDWRSIVWSAERGVFVVIGTGSLAMVSNDGITWTTRIVSNSLWVSVTWAPEIGLFLAASYNGTSMYSYDGTSWTLWPGGPGNAWAAVAWSPGLNRFAVVGQSGTGNRVMTADGILTNQGGNLAVSGILTSANPWIRGRFTSTAAPSYIPMTLLQGSGISVTNSTYLYPPVAGRYVVGFNSIFNSSSVRNDLYIRLNGADLVDTLSEDSTTGYHYRGASTIVYLYPTDYIQFFVGAGGTTYPPTAATGEWSNFYMALIS